VAQFEIDRVEAAIPEAEPGAIQTARDVLNRGREQAAQRQRNQRAVGVLALAAAPVGWLAARRSPLSRRRFLAALSMGVASLAGALGGGALILSEFFRAEELRGYDAAQRALARLSKGNR
jgi:hypothetical protein